MAAVRGKKWQAGTRTRAFCCCLIELKHSIMRPKLMCIQALMFSSECCKLLAASGTAYHPLCEMEMLDALLFGEMYRNVPMTEIKTWDIVSAMGSVGVVWNVTACKVIQDCFIRRDLFERSL